MAERFTDLLRRCRKRRRKIWLKRAGVAVGLLLVAGGGMRYMQESARQPVTTAAVTTPKPEKHATPAPARPAAPAKAANVRGPAPEPAPAPTAPKKAAAPAVRKEPVGLKKPSPTPKPPPVSAAPGPGPDAGEASPKSPPHPKRKEPEAPVVSEKENPPGKPGPLVVVKDVTDLDALVKQFRKTPRYATALRIARIHFERGEYEAASLWARKANLLDRDDEAAWLLYARSEYALGRRERAIRILRLYLDYRDSAGARALLMSWSRR